MPGYAWNLVVKVMTMQMSIQDVIVVPRENYRSCDRSYAAVQLRSNLYHQSGTGR